jgi:hypothetical protein
MLDNKSLLKYNKDLYISLESVEYPNLLNYSTIRYPFN